MAGGRFAHVEQSLGFASARPVRPGVATHHASHSNQGKRAGLLSKTMRVRELTLRMVRLPLLRPYVLSYRTSTDCEPIIVEVRDGEGGSGWGEGHISPGSSRETREGGWAFCQQQAAAIVGKDTREA